jgi:thiamine transport system substrate-binding protein
LLISKASYLQIEGVGILKGAKHPDLAKTFIDFMLRPEFQKDLPGAMYVYPVRRGTSLTPEFERFAQVPSEPARLDEERVKTNWSRWLKEWDKVMT